MAQQIRTFGDPVLKTKAAAVTDIDGKVARLVDDMFDVLDDTGQIVGKIGFEDFAALYADQQAEQTRAGPA